MAAAHVQDAAVGAASSATAQATSNFAAQPTVGNYIVAFAWGWNNHTHTNAPTFSDSNGGNTWVIPTNCYQNQAVDLWCVCGYAKVAATGAGFNVTATYSNSAGSVVVCAAEFSGVAASSPLDGAAGAGATGTGVTVAPGNLTVTAGSLVVYVGVDDNNTFTGSTPAGFTRVGFENSGASFEVGEGAYAVGPSSPANPSRTITSAKWGAAQFALLAAAVASQTPCDPYPMPQPMMAMRHRQPGHDLPTRKWWRATESGRLLAPDMNIARAA